MQQKGTSDPPGWVPRWARGSAPRWGSVANERRGEGGALSGAHSQPPEGITQPTARGLCMQHQVRLDEYYLCPCSSNRGYAYDRSHRGGLGPIRDADGPRWAPRWAHRWAPRKGSPWGTEEGGLGGGVGGASASVKVWRARAAKGMTGSHGKGGWSAHTLSFCPIVPFLTLMSQLQSRRRRPQPSSSPSPSSSLSSSSSLSPHLGGRGSGGGRGLLGRVSGGGLGKLKTGGGGWLSRSHEGGAHAAS
jgi:hypothetical protein